MSRLRPCTDLIHVLHDDIRSKGRNHEEREEHEVEATCLRQVGVDPTSSSPPAELRTRHRSPITRYHRPSAKIQDRFWSNDAKRYSSTIASYDRSTANRGEITAYWYRRRRTSRSLFVFFVVSFHLTFHVGRANTNGQPQFASPVTGSYHDVMSMTSPPFRVDAARHNPSSMPSATNLTAPSISPQLTPPMW